MRKLPDQRLAVIGCGRMGATRTRAVQALGGRVRYFCDLDRELARALAGDDGEVVDRPEEVLELDLDALFLCTPPDARGAVVKTCRARGLPVLLEKPVATGRAAADELRSLPPSDSTVVVGYMNRHRASILHARDAVRREGVLGASGLWACGRYAKDWWLDPLSSGGPVNEQMTHLVDLMRFVVGEVETVTALSAGRETDPDRMTEAAVALRFEGGALGTILYTCETNQKGIGLRVVTRERTLALEGWDFRDEEHESESGDEVFLAETRAFLASARGERAAAALATLEDSLRTQDVVDRIKDELRGAHGSDRGRPQPR